MAAWAVLGAAFQSSQLSGRPGLAGGSGDPVLGCAERFVELPTAVVVFDQAAMGGQRPGGEGQCGEEMALGQRAVGEMGGHTLLHQRVDRWRQVAEIKLVSVID